jgi:hypothetical protein
MGTKGTTKTKVSVVSAVAVILSVDVRNRKKKKVTQSMKSLIQSIPNQDPSVPMDQLTIRASHSLMGIVRNIARESSLSIANVIRVCLVHAITCKKCAIKIAQSKGSDDAISNA